MVRTAATAIKTGGGKSSKGAALSGGNAGGSTTSAHKSRTTIGGNKVLERPIPKWQKPISNFFNTSAPPGQYIKVRSFMQMNQSFEEDIENEAIEVPEWQKPVTMFFREETTNEQEQATTGNADIESESGTSKSSHAKRKHDEIEEKENVEKKTVYVTVPQVDVNPSKRVKIDYKSLEEFEKC